MMTRPSFMASLLCVALLHPNISFSQFVFNKKTNIAVKKGSNPILKYPWTGGFSNPQFSGADINHDGIKDLVVFDRTGDKAVTFINHGSSGTIDYEHKPEYEPAYYGFSQWMLMDDFDCDGKADVFTYNIGAADYYKGSFTADNILYFDSVTFFGYPAIIGGGIINVFISAIDIAAFADINDDGDLDILTFGPAGGTLNYYENQSQELTGTCGDTVLFELYDECWGGFFEPSNTNEVELNNCRVCFTPMGIPAAMPEYKNSGERAHSGSTVLAFDEDGDGDKEVILGDISFEAINRLVNCGTTDTACICDQDPTFPSYDKSYKLQIYPASFYVDINNDGLRDLLVAPNQPGTSENYKCIWLYENVGTQDSVVFHYVSDTFLIGQTLDFGEGAYPAFLDYNADGLLDLVVGNYGYYVNGVTYRSGLALLENTGTITAPSFKLVDPDFANVSDLGRKAVFPAFGDMDGDGDQDMIIGEFDGFLHYYRNTAPPGNAASFSPVHVQMFGIDVGQFSAPFIYDVNGDSLPDLLVGEKSGNGTAQHKGQINYFENKGTRTGFVFDTLPTNDIFGEVDVRIPGWPNGYCTPVVSPLDSSGQLYLLSGSEEGKVKVFEYDSSKRYSGAFTKRFNAYSSIDEGERTAIAIADLNNDGMMEMVVGNARGGVAFFTQSDMIYTEITGNMIDMESFHVKVFPNPAHDFLMLEMANFQGSSKFEVALFNLVGKKMWSGEIEAQPRQTLKLPAVPSGIYLVRLSSGHHASLSKIAVNLR